MRILLKCAAIIGVITLVATYLSAEVADSSEKDKFVYLFAGLDDAAENTDSLMLVGYDASGATASVVQLPRDTYINIGTRRNKINQIYSSCKLEGNSRSEAMKRTSMLIADTFGIKVDGYVAITTEGLRDIVNALGGVKITLAKPMTIGEGNDALKLSAGENILNGADAERFVRHRSDYVTADLGRIDAQKIFLGGLYRSVIEGTNTQSLIKMIGTVGPDITTDINLIDVVLGFVKHSSKFRNVPVNYLTMPGRAIADSSGIWYYVINRASALEVIKRHLFYKDGIFDINNMLVNRADKEFEKIYYSDPIYYKQYTQNELEEIDIPKME